MRDERKSCASAWSTQTFGDMFDGDSVIECQEQWGEEFEYGVDA